MSSLTGKFILVFFYIKGCESNRRENNCMERKFRNLYTQQNLETSTWNTRWKHCNNSRLLVREKIKEKRKDNKKRK